MSRQTSRKFSPEVRSCAVRMVLDHEPEHLSRWAAVSSVAAKHGRIGEPEEVVQAALFLASDESSFVTGTHLFVDNRFTAV